MLCSSDRNGGSLPSEVQVRSCQYCPTQGLFLQPVIGMIR